MGQTNKSRKEILQRTLENIENNISRLYERGPYHMKLKVMLSAFGICHLIKINTEKYYEKPYSKKLVYTEVHNILQDVQKVNGIEFNKDEFFKPFCSKTIQYLSTINDLKEWYKKRIEVIEKTIEYYDK